MYLLRERSLDAEDEGTLVLPNIDKLLPVNMA
jgi:hypothetical protein